MFLAWLQGIAGLAALASVVVQWPFAASLLALLAGVAGITQLVVRPSQRAADFREAARGFTLLEAEGWSMTPLEIATRIAQIRASTDAGPDGLVKLAYREALVSLGGDGKTVELSRWERVFSVVG